MAVDYPAGVEPGSERRIVEVSYTLRNDGSVVGCEIIQSSGEQRLDEETCRILRERGRFPGGAGGPLQVEWFGAPSLDNPARRGDPLPIEDGDEAVSGDALTVASREDRGRGSALIEVDVSDDGTPLGCRVADGSEAMSLGRAQCRMYVSNGRFIPASDGAGGRRRGIYRAIATWGPG